MAMSRRLDLAARHCSVLHSCSYWSSASPRAGGKAGRKRSRPGLQGDGVPLVAGVSFGDPLTARLDLLVDPAAVDPAAIQVHPRFGLFRVTGTSLERTRGDGELLSYGSRSNASARAAHRRAIGSRGACHPRP